ncbi:MAG: hypothetical protein HY063_13410 [Bacteroidetes bacterium]|nr:hypothetical protein [Bacteroidota bacterium]
MSANEKKIILIIFFIPISFFSFSQQTSFSGSDSLHSLYHIVTLKDGTVLKGKIISEEKRETVFQDELLGNVSFHARDVASIAQIEPQEFYLITLMNGTILQGKIINKKEKEIIVETSAIGNVIVDVNKIKNIQVIAPGNFPNGKYWFKTSIDAHYFITPSSIPLNTNEAYYQNTMGLFNGFEASLSKNFSLSGGVILPVAVFIAPHLSYKISNGIYAGGGGLFSLRTGKQYSAFGYGMLTFGNRNSHISIGGGYGYFTYQNRRYYYLHHTYNVYVNTFTLSAEHRLTPHCALVTENWLAFDNKIKFLTAGMRYMGEKNSFDFGFGNFSLNKRVFGIAVSGMIPFVSYLRNL